MSRGWNRLETWLGLFVVAVGGVLAAVAGLHVYVTATATPLHPDPQGVPSVTEAAPAPQWSDAVQEARQIVRAGVTELNLPGLSVAVGVRGDMVWAEGFGWADLDSRMRVSPKTRFRIGTASMALTSAAVGLLLEQGRLTLDDEIQAQVPEFPKKPWPVTLRHLMGHTAGVRNDGGDEGPLLGRSCERPLEGLDAFADRPLLFEPGTQFRQSRYGWIAVSAAVEAAANHRLVTFMRDEIFVPLRMADTRADSSTEEGFGRATPYFPRYSADPRYGPDPMRPVDYSCYAGASVFVSTPSDLVRFGMAIDAGTLLQPATVELLQQSQRLPSGEETGYGLGWDRGTVLLAGTPTLVVGHDGDSLGGNVSSLMILRQHGIVVAVTANTSYADTPSIAAKVADAFARRPAPAATR